MYSLCVVYVFLDIYIILSGSISVFSTILIKHTVCKCTITEYVLEAFALILKFDIDIALCFEEFLISTRCWMQLLLLCHCFVVWQLRMLFGVVWFLFTLDGMCDEVSSRKGNLQKAIPFSLRSWWQRHEGIYFKGSHIVT